MSAARAEGLVVPKNVPVADAPPPPPPANWLDYNARPLTLSKGMLGIHADIVSNLSSGKGGKPVNIAPNLYYGVTDQLTIGVAENPEAEFLPVGYGLCLGGTYCNNKFFNNVSGDLLFSLARAPTMELVFHGGIDLAPLSPFTVSGRGGVLMKFIASGPIAIMADPSVSAGITGRGPPTNNREYLNVPIRVGYQAAPQANVGLIADINGALDPPMGTFFDGFSIPVGLNGWLTPNEKLDIGANFTFLNLAGRGGGLAGRTLALSANYRL
jgi:hypothetical protein